VGITRHNGPSVPARRSSLRRVDTAPPPSEYGRRLRGYRIFLRRLAAGDQAEFLQLVRESRNVHHPWVSPPTGVAGFQRLVHRAEQETVVSLLICARSTATMLGVFNLSQIFRGNFRSAYLGYYGHAGFAGRGYMGEGLELVMRYAFTKLLLHRIEANIQPGNLKSVALVERCGFAKEGFSPRYLKVAGRWRDHERWAITVERWRAARPPDRTKV
jgi:[ribosomal protein S5]-alanine N-acetyltransferase